MDPQDPYRLPPHSYPPRPYYEDPHNFPPPPPPYLPPDPYSQPPAWHPQHGGWVWQPPNTGYRAPPPIRPPAPPQIDNRGRPEHLEPQTYRRREEFERNRPVTDHRRNSERWSEGPRSPARRNSPHDSRTRSRDRSPKQGRKRDNRKDERKTSTSRSRDRQSSRSHDSSSRSKDSKHTTRPAEKRPSQKRKSGCLSDDDLDEIESQVNVEEEVNALKASYTQSTQHGNIYKRVMESDSTVEGTKKLEEVYNKFEKRLGTRHKDLWTPNEPESSTETPYAVLNEEINLNQSTQISVEKIRKWEHNFKLTRHQRAKSSMIAKKLLDSAEKQELSLSEYINKKQPSVPNFSLRKLQKVLDGGDAEDSDLEEGELDQAGELINMIRKNKAHKDRLHDELWYNEPGHANDGLLCRCSEHAKSKGIRHNIYPGEEKLPSCHPLKNNIGKLYHYRVTVGPAVNFMIATPTTIEHNGQDYYFEGFSMFSHEPLDKIPLCDIIRFHIRYTIYLIEETPPENFCMRGLDLFHDYLFREILELYDWESRDPRFEISTESENSRKFRFFPRFVRSLPDNGKEILSLSKVLEYLQENDQPLVDDDELDQLMRCSHDDWLKYAEKVRGMIVTYPGKKPSSLRVDQLDRYDRVPVESKSDQNHPVDERYPMIVHFGIRPANLSYAGDPQYQRIWRAYLKLRHLMANSPNVKPADKKKLRERQDALQKIRRAKDMQREVTVELSSKGFRRTGIYSDVCQHALLLPVLTHHLRYHLCLKSLERSIGYHFKERKWLSHAMNHPSCHMNFGLNPDHVRNALSNCGLRLPRYGDSSIHYKYTRKRGITTLIRIMARLGQHRPVLSPIEHNERLEFLGDAVVGYFTSVHLFLMFPDLSEGALTTFRTVLVNNQHLATLAERLRLDEYMLYAHGPDLCRKADLRHAMANCFEALMGAIYMEGGLETAKKLFGEFLWETPKLRSVWRDLPLHPLQEEKPGTDRPCIKDVPILQKLTKFEDAIGVEFNHIRILAKAFTWRNVYENILTRGHNQRLEFLGDSICNLVASTYLFRRYPTHHEGHLTLLRATIVNGRTQSLVATELGMPEYVICNLDGENSGGKAPEWREKNLADLLEAFVAALFVDKGLKYVEGFMQVCFFPRLKEFILTQEWNDPKSCLQQCCLTLRQEGKEPQLPTYDISHQTGPSHARKYVVSVYFKGEAIGTGTGESIQKAERNAARTALQEYNFPQLEWQRRYVAEKHDLPYAPRKNLKKIEPKRDESSQPAVKTAKLDSKPVTSD